MSKATFYYKVNALVLKINKEVNMVLEHFDYMDCKKNIEDEIILELLSCNILLCDVCNMPYVSTAVDIWTLLEDTISSIPWETDTSIVSEINTRDGSSYIMSKLTKTIQYHICELFKVQDGLLAEFKHDNIRIYM